MSCELIDGLKSKVYWFLYHRYENHARIKWQSKKYHVNCLICGETLSSDESDYSPIDCGWKQLKDFSDFWVCHRCLYHRNFRPYVRIIDEKAMKEYEKRVTRYNEHMKQCKEHKEKYKEHLKQYKIHMKKAMNW